MSGLILKDLLHIFVTVQEIMASAKSGAFLLLSSRPPHCSETLDDLCSQSRQLVRFRPPLAKTPNPSGINRKKS